MDNEERDARAAILACALFGLLVATGATGLSLLIGGLSITQLTGAAVFAWVIGFLMGAKALS